MLRHDTCMTSKNGAIGDRKSPVLTAKQAAEYVRLRPQTLRVRKCQRTGPRWFKHGRSKAYYPADLDAWLRERLT